MRRSHGCASAAHGRPGLHGAAPARAGATTTTPPLPTHGAGRQVLQTLSIIIQNVRSETAVFFLFSNNHINNIIDLDFDFDDEEVGMGWGRG